MPPYIVMSFVGFGLIANQIRQVVIKVTEALRLSIMKVSWLIAIGVYSEGTIKYVTEDSKQKNFDGEQNSVVTFMTW
jgi:hypothetical protein